jgi:hypothetical protein
MKSTTINQPYTGSDSNKLALSAKSYLFGIQLLGLVTLVYGIREGLLRGSEQWIYLVVLTALASLLSTQVSRRGTRAGSVTISLGDLFVFAAMVILGPTAAAVMGAVEGLVSSWRVKVKHLRKVLFNMAQLALSAFLVGLLVQRTPIHLTATEGLSVGTLFLMLGCGLLYFLLNSLLVTVAMWQVSRRPMSEMGRKGFLWALPTIGVNASLVVILLSLLGPVQISLVLALLPLLLVAYLLTGIRDTSETSGLFTGRFLPESFTEKAKGYLLIIVLVAVPIYLYCLHQSVSLQDHSWLYLAVLAVGASCFPIRLFSVSERIWLTLSDVFVFVALFQFGPEVAVVVASIEALAFNLRKRTQPSYRWVFNLAQIILVAFLVGGFFRLLQTGLTHPQGFGPGTVVLLLMAPWLCGFLYYALSSGLTGMVMALTNGQSFLKVWVTNLVWYQVSVIGAVCAALTYVLVHNFSSLI